MKQKTYWKIGLLFGMAFALCTHNISSDYFSLWGTANSIECKCWPRLTTPRLLIKWQTTRLHLWPGPLLRRAYDLVGNLVMAENLPNKFQPQIVPIQRSVLINDELVNFGVRIALANGEAGPAPGTVARLRLWCG